MPSRREGGARFISRQFLYLADDDVAEISAALLSAFPRLRFHSEPWKIKATDPIEPNRAALRPSEILKGPETAPPNSNWDIAYYSGLLGDGWETTVWVEPENWRPEWGINRWGFPGLANYPELNFTFRPCHINTTRTTLRLCGDPLPGCGANEYQWMVEADFQGVYYPWEPEQLSFLRQIRRIFDKHTTNQCVAVDFETLKPTHISLKGAMDRIGRHAAAWAMAHPRRYLGRAEIKPIEWAERYPNGWIGP